MHVSVDLSWLKEMNEWMEKSIDKSDNNTLHTFTVCKCHIKWLAYERRNKLTMHLWIEYRIEQNRIGFFYESASSSSEA